MTAEEYEDMASRYIRAIMDAKPQPKPTEFPPECIARAMKSPAQEYAEARETLLNDLIAYGSVMLLQQVVTGAFNAGMDHVYETLQKGK